MYARRPVGVSSTGTARDRQATWAVIVAAGGGTRFGGRKQFAHLGGRPVLAWSLDMARACCGGVVVVVPADMAVAVRGDEALAAALDGVDATVAGGRARSDSVRAGLEAVPPRAEIVVVHDAARPLASLLVWEAVIDAVAAGADGAVPAVALSDTVTQVGPGGELRSLDRSTLRAVQTPQAFRAAALRRAHEAGADATDDATLVGRAGGRVVLVDGHHANLKITEPTDLAVAAALLEAIRL